MCLMCVCVCVVPAVFVLPNLKYSHHYFNNAYNKLLHMSCNASMVVRTDTKTLCLVRLFGTLKPSKDYHGDGLK